MYPIGNWASIAWHTHDILYTQTHTHTTQIQRRILIVCHSVVKCVIGGMEIVVVWQLASTFDIGAMIPSRPCHQHQPLSSSVCWGSLALCWGLMGAPAGGGWERRVLHKPLSISTSDLHDPARSAYQTQGQRSQDSHTQSVRLPQLTALMQQVTTHQD